MIEQNPPSKFAKLKEAAQKAKPATEQAPAPKRDFKSLYLTGQESTPSPAPAPSISTPPPTSAPAFQSPSTPKAPAAPSVTGIFRDEINTAPKIEMPGPGASVSDFRPQKSIAGLPQEQPSYRYKGMPFTQKDAMAQIYKAQSPQELEGLQVSNDPIAMKGLQRRMESFAQPQTESKPQNEVNPFMSYLNIFSSRIANTPADLGEGWAIASAAIERGLGKLGVPGANKDLKATDIATYKGSENWRKFMDEVYPVNKPDRETFLGGVMDGLGQVVPLALTGGTSAMPKVAMQATKAGTNVTPFINTGKEIVKRFASKEGVLAGSQIAAPSYKQAKEQGASEDEALRFAIENYAVGSVVENLPIQSMFSRIAKIEPKAPILNIVKEGVVGGGEEAVTEMWQTTYENWSANRIYNANREIFDGIGEAGSIGGAVGFILNAATTALIGKRARTSNPQERETLTKAITELEQKQQQVEQNNDQLAKNVKALELSSLMGEGLGPKSFGTTKPSNVERRKQAGKVVLAKDKNGKTIEITGVSKPQEDGSMQYTAITPGGKFFKVNENDITDVTDVDLDTFNQVLEGKFENTIDQETEVNTQVTNQAASAIDQFRAEFQPFAIPTPMGEVVGLAQLDGQDVFVLQDQPNGNVLVQSPGQPRQIVAKNRLQGSQFLPFDQFVSQFGPVPQEALAPFDPSNPVQAGEEVEIGGQNYVVTGVNYDTNQVALELQDGDNVDVLDIPLEAFQSYRKPAETTPSAPTAPQAPTPAAEAPKSGASKLRELFPTEEQKKQLEANKKTSELVPALGGEQQVANEILGNEPATSATESPSIPAQPASQEQAGVGNPTPEDAPAQPVGEGVDSQVQVGEKPLKLKYGGKDVDLKGNPQKEWMKPIETAEQATKRISSFIEASNYKGRDFSAFIDRNGENTEVKLREDDGKWNWYYPNSKKPFASFDSVKKAVEFIQSQPFWENGVLNKIGKTDDYFIKSKKEFIQRELQSGNILQDILDGRISANDAKKTIDAVGLDIPESLQNLINQPTTTNEVQQPQSSGQEVLGGLPEAGNQGKKGQNGQQLREEEVKFRKEPSRLGGEKTIATKDGKDYELHFSGDQMGREPYGISFPNEDNIRFFNKDKKASKLWQTIKNDFESYLNQQTTTNEVQQPQQTGQAGQKDVQAQQNQEDSSQEGEGQEGLEGPVLNQPKKGSQVYDRSKKQNATILKISKPKKGSALEGEPFILDVKYEDGKKAINMPASRFAYDGKPEPTSNEDQIALDAMFEAIAQKAESVEEFMDEARKIKSVPANIRNYFYEKYGGKESSPVEAARNYWTEKRQGAETVQNPSKAESVVSKLIQSGATREQIIKRGKFLKQKLDALKLDVIGKNGKELKGADPKKSDQYKEYLTEYLALSNLYDRGFGDQSNETRPFAVTMRELDQKQSEFQKNPSQQKYNEIISIYKKLFADDKIYGSTLSPMTEMEFENDLELFHQTVPDSIQKSNPQTIINSLASKFDSVQEDVDDQTDELPSGNLIEGINDLEESEIDSGNKVMFSVFGQTVTGIKNPDGSFTGDDGTKYTSSMVSEVTLITNQQENEAAKRYQRLETKQSTNPPSKNTGNDGSVPTQQGSGTTNDAGTTNQPDSGLPDAGSDTNRRPDETQSTTGTKPDGNSGIVKAVDIFPELKKLEENLENQKIPAKKDKIDIKRLENEGFEKIQEIFGDAWEMNLALNTQPIKASVTSKDPVKALSTIVSKEELRPAMMAVYANPDKQEYVATDGHVLVVIPGKVTGEKRLIDPATGQDKPWVHQWKSKSGKMDREETLRYPDYEGVTPDGSNNHRGKAINIEDILPKVRGMVKAMKFTTGGDGNYDDHLRMVAQMEFEGDVTTVNPLLLDKAITALAETGTKKILINIPIGQKSRNRGTLIKDADNPKKYALVMPMMNNGLYYYQPLDISGSQESKPKNQKASEMLTPKTESKKAEEKPTQKAADLVNQPKSSSDKFTFQAENPMKQGKSLAYLEKNIRVDGKVMPIYQYIEGMGPGLAVEKVKMYSSKSEKGYTEKLAIGDNLVDTVTEQEYYKYLQNGGKPYSKEVQENAERERIANEKAKQEREKADQERADKEKKQAQEFEQKKLEQIKRYLTEGKAWTQTDRFQNEINELSQKRQTDETKDQIEFLKRAEKQYYDRVESAFQVAKSHYSIKNGQVVPKFDFKVGDPVLVNNVMTEIESLRQNPNGTTTYKVIKKEGIVNPYVGYESILPQNQKTENSNLFNNWKISGRSITHSQPGKKLTQEEAQNIIDQIANSDLNPNKQINYAYYNPNTEKLIFLGDTEIAEKINQRSGNVFLQNQKFEQQEAEKARKEKEKADNLKNAIDQNSSARDWIDTVFGSESMNDFNKKALIDFITGSAKSFNGMASPKWRSGLESLGALNGNDIDFNKIKSAFQNKDTSAPKVDSSDPNVDTSGIYQGTKYDGEKARMIKDPQGEFVIDGRMVYQADQFEPGKEYFEQRRGVFVENKANNRTTVSAFEYLGNGKPEDAIALRDKVNAMPDQKRVEVQVNDIIFDKLKVSVPDSGLRNKRFEPSSADNLEQFGDRLKEYIKDTPQKVKDYFTPKEIEGLYHSFAIQRMQAKAKAKQELEIGSYVNDKRYEDAITYFENLNKPTPKAAALVSDPASQPVKEQLQDVGEKIGGAKKDGIRKYFDKINLNGRILSNIFPKPDIASLLDSGMKPKDVGAIKVAYEFAVQDKKKGPEVIKFYAAYAKTVLAESINLEFKNNNYVFTDYGKSQIELRSAAYEAVYNQLGKEYLSLDLSKARIFELTPEMKKRIVFSKNPVKDFNVNYYYRGDKYFDTKEEAIQQFVEEIKANTKLDAKEYKYKPGIFSLRRGGGIVIGLQRKGKEFITLKDGFKDVKEASEYLKSNMDDIQLAIERILAEQKTEGAKPRVTLKLINETSRDRVGKDWRNGKDVSSEEFASTFGFRGVEFGNWVNVKERQAFVNATYDSLMDMAQILNITPKSISLNGELAIAFGSRGSGQASAHYEPGRKVINLTKTKGLGALAHEWYHAMDNYFAGFGEKVTGMKAATQAEFKENTRPEIKEAFDQIKKALEKGEFRKRSKTLDSKKNKDYYATPVEMAARAFENYVLTRLNESGQINDFLVNYVSTEEWNGEPNMYPYPLGEESKAIREAFDNLTQTVKVDEGTPKQPLYMIIGERGASRLDQREEATVRMDNLAVARQMEAEGIQPVFDAYVKAKAETDRLNKAKDYTTDREVFLADIEKMYQALGYSWFEADRDIHRAMQEAADKNNISLLPPSKGNGLIRMATGWERGADGKWRYEVQDPIIDDQLINELQANEGLANRRVTFQNITYKKYPDGTYDITMVEKGATSIDQMAHYRGIPENELDSYIDSPSIVDQIKNQEGQESAMNNRDGNFDTEGVKEINTEFKSFVTGGYNLPLVAKDKSLYRMYPELKKIVVVVDSKMEGQGAFVERSDGSKIIKVNPKKQPKSEIASTILHEIQHAIQYQEGFAGGGNVALATASQVKAIEKELAKINKEIIDLGEVRKTLKGEDWDKNVAKHKELVAKRDALDTKKASFENNMAPGYLAYRSVAGEVEARNVQGRARLSPEERRANTLQSTEDVAREDQIFLESAGVQMSESAPRPNRAGDLLNRPATPTQAKQLDKVQAEANRITGNWKNGPAIEVYPNGAAIEAAFPQVEFRDMDRVPGLFYNGKVILNAAHPFHNQPGGTETIILHESIGHFGMGNVINELSAQQGKDADQEYARIMQDVYDRYQDTELMQYVAKTYFGKDPATLSEAEQIEAGEEYIAHTAQTGVKDKWIDRVISNLRDILRKLGFDLKMADAELRAIIGRASRFVVDGPSRMQVEGQIRPSMMIRDTDQTQTPEFKAWFGDSKVVDENGKPLVVYHGTPNASFDQFKSNSHFTANPEYASNYINTSASSAGNGPKRSDSPAVYPVYLSIKNPFDTRVPKNAKLYQEFTRTFGNGTPLSERGLPDWTDSDNLLEWIEETGQKFDGLILDEGGTPNGGWRGISYVPLNPTQIKSATGNVGTFSPDDPDIRYTMTPSGSGIRINNFVPADKQTKIQNRLENSPNFLSNPRYMVQPAGVETKSVENQRRKGFLAGSKAFFEGKNPISQEKRTRARENFQDAMLPGRRMIERKAGDLIKDESNFYVKENLAADKVVFQIGQMERKHIAPIKALTDQIQEKHGVTFEQIEDYLGALHNEERRNYLSEKNPDDALKYKDNPKWPTGMTDEEANQIIKDYESKVPQADRDKLNGMVKDLVNFSLDTRLEAGLISQAYYDQLKTQYDFYVPLRGWADRIEYDPTKYSPMKEAKGRISKAASPLAYLYADAADAIAHGERNKVFQSMYQFVMEHPDKNEYMVKASYFRKSKKDDGTETWVEMDESEGKPSKEEIKKGTVIRGFNPEIMKDIALAKHGDLTLPVFIKGQKVYILFAKQNEQLVKALKNTAYSKIEGLAKFSSKFTGFLSSAFTEYSPEFGFVNGVRDMQMGNFSVILEDGPEMAAATMKKYPKSIKELYSHFWNQNIEKASNPYLKEFMESGAFTGFSQAKEVKDIYKMLSNQSLAKKWDETKLARLVSTHNKSIENAYRFAYFQAMREKGYTVQKAASKAKDVTVNFRRRGNMTSSVGAYFAFFNAGVQGIERFTRPFFKADTRNAAAAVAGTLFATGFMQAAMYNLFGAIDEEDDELMYDKIPEFTRSMNIIIPFPNATGYVTVPMGYGLNVPYALGELTANVAAGKKTPGSAMMRALTIISESFSPLGGYEFESNNQRPSQKAVQFVSPTFSKPIIDLAINSNFFGARIIQEQPWEKGVPNSQLATPSTSKTAIRVSEMINSATGGDDVVPGNIDLNPTALEYLAKQYGGGPLSFGNKVLTTYELLRDGENPLIQDNVRKAPFVSRFYQDANNSGSVLSKYFKNREEVLIALDRYESYLKTNRPELAEEYYQTNRHLIEMENFLKSYDKGIKSIRKAMEAAELEGDQEEVKQLKKERDNLMKEYNAITKMTRGDKQVRASDLLK